MDSVGPETNNHCAGESQQQLSSQSVESCSCEKQESGIWGRGQFGNPEKGERPPLEAATKQRLVKTGKTLCAL
jgi:hypothetical protein